VFVYGNLGDCKAFHYNPRTGHIGDITPEARVNNDASDCGGRLGPYVNGEHPDLRNFRLRFMPCCTGDLIFVLSDGVYDNLDPEHLGKTPQEMGLDAESWDDAPFLEAEKLRLKFRLELLRQIILPEYQAGDDEDTPAEETTTLGDAEALQSKEKAAEEDEQQSDSSSASASSSSAKSGGTVVLKSRATPKVITDEDRRYAESSPTDYRAMKPHHITWSLLEQTLKTNTAAIQWMEANPGKPLQSNYKKFPGKMDHTTCASFRVGFLSPEGKIISSEEAAQLMPPRTTQVVPPGPSSSSSSSSNTSAATAAAGGAGGGGLDASSASSAASELRKSGGKGTGTGTGTSTGTGTGTGTGAGAGTQNYSGGGIEKTPTVSSLRYFVVSSPEVPGTDALNCSAALAAAHPTWQEDHYAGAETVFFATLSRARWEVFEVPHPLAGEAVRVERTLSPDHADIFLVPFFSKLYKKHWMKTCNKPLHEKIAELVDALARTPHWCARTPRCGSRHVWVVGAGSGPLILSDAARHIMNSTLLVPDGGVRGFDFAKDIQVPWPTAASLPLVAPAVPSPPPRRDILVYMRCAFVSDPLIRGALYHAFHTAPQTAHRTDIVVTFDHVHVSQVQDEFTRAVFCIIPCGVTPGTRRFHEAVLSGCIPVVVCDRWRGEFPSTVQYSRFVVHHPESDIVALPGRLMALSAEAVRDMQAHLTRVAPAFSWHRDAMAYTFQELVGRFIQRPLRATAPPAPWPAVTQPGAHQPLSFLFQEPVPPPRFLLHLAAISPDLEWLKSVLTLRVLLHMSCKNVSGSNPPPSFFRVDSIVRPAVLVSSFTAHDNSSRAVLPDPDSPTPLPDWLKGYPFARDVPSSRLKRVVADVEASPLVVATVPAVLERYLCDLLGLKYPGMRLRSVQPLDPAHLLGATRQMANHGRLNCPNTAAMEIVFSLPGATATYVYLALRRALSKESRAGVLEWERTFYGA